MSELRAEFIRGGADDGEVLGTASWDGSRVAVASEDEEVRAALWRIFRPTAVVVEDPSMRVAGTSGPVVLPPGSRLWFEAAARTRAPGEGLHVRFVPQVGDRVGWDPAGAYRPFVEVIERKDRPGADA